MLPEEPTQQSSLLAQGVRQTALTHSSSVTWTPAQSAPDRHCGFGPVSGWQMFPMQRSAVGQSASAWQAGWQMPLMQVLPAPQSALNTHWPPEVMGAWQ